MWLRMLGPVRVLGEAGWVPVPGGQQRLLLALLMVDAGRIVSTDRLIDEIWGARPPGTAVKMVHKYVMRLRRLITGHCGALVTCDHGYQLALHDEDLDARGFERLCDSGRAALASGQSDAAASRFAAALALWQGPALDDVPARPALAARIAHLEQIRLAAEEDHAAAVLDIGRYRDVVTQLPRLVEEHPLRERRWALLMRALAEAGRRAEALEAFHRARRLLQAELGLEPGPELREREALILHM